MRLRLDTIWAETSATLERAGIEAPRREARLLLAHALGRDPVLLPPDLEIEPETVRALTARRAAREPLAFITGRRGFWRFEFDVSPATLIPRPDSEALIEALRASVPRPEAVRRILDLGTGTGCLLIAALDCCPAAFGVGVDLAHDAALLAAGNAARLGFADRAGFLAGHWAEALNGAFDLILCNPPYIDSAAMDELMPEVGRFEPARALHGGPDGLDAYRSVIADLPRLLAPGGIAILELGIGQAEPCASIARNSGFAGIQTRPDLNGIPRALVLHKQCEDLSWRPPGSVFTVQPAP